MRCLLGLSNVQQHLLEPPTGIYVFQTPSGDRNSAKEKQSLDALQKNPKAPYYSLFTSLLPRNKMNMINIFFFNVIKFNMVFL